MGEDPPDDGTADGSAIGLGADIRACLFDLDGVLTKTAAVHSAAWKESFDEFLRRYDAHTGRKDQPFDENSDYENYVDGKTREDGVRGFLTSRGIELPEGASDDPGRRDGLRRRRGQAAGVPSRCSTSTVRRSSTARSPTCAPPARPA